MQRLETRHFWRVRRCDLASSKKQISKQSKEEHKENIGEIYEAIFLAKIRYVNHAQLKKE